MFVVIVSGKDRHLNFRVSRRESNHSASEAPTPGPPRLFSLPAFGNRKESACSSSTAHSSSGGYMLVVDRNVDDDRKVEFLRRTQRCKLSLSPTDRLSPTDSSLDRANVERLDATIATNVIRRKN